MWCVTAWTVNVPSSHMLNTELPSDSTSAKTHCDYWPAPRVFLDSLPAQNICSPGTLVFGLSGGGGGRGAEEKLNSGSPANLHFAKYRMWRPERRSIGCVLPRSPIVINTVNEAEWRRRNLLHEDCCPAFVVLFVSWSVLRINGLAADVRIADVLRICWCDWTTVCLTLILLTWRIWWDLNNASRWQMGFNSAFKRLTFRHRASCI